MLPPEIIAHIAMFDPLPFRFLRVCKNSYLELYIEVLPVIDWHIISSRGDLPDSFIRKWSHRLCLEEMVVAQRIPTYMAQDAIDSLVDYESPGPMCIAIHKQTLDEDFICDTMEYLEGDSFHGPFCTHVAQSQDLTSNLVSLLEDYINWHDWTSAKKYYRFIQQEKDLIQPCYIKIIEEVLGIKIISPTPSEPA